MKIIDSLGNPRLLGTLLAGSLAVNIFLGGAVIGRMSAHRMPPPPMFAPGGDTLFRFVPEAQRLSMRNELHEQHPELRSLHQEMRQLHREIAAELSRDQPDRQAIEQKLAAVRTKMESMEEAMHKAFLDTVLALPTEKRRALVEDMKHHRGPPPPGAGHLHGSAPRMEPPPFNAPMPPPEEAPDDPH